MVRVPVVGGSLAALARISVAALAVSASTFSLAEVVHSGLGDFPAAAQAGAQVAIPAGQQGGWQYMVRSGDTLDRIIAQTQAASPFALAFLREAFAKLNPAALPRGAKGPLLAGTLLRIPTSAELRQLAFPELESGGSTSLASSAAPGHAAPMSAAQRQEFEQRHWIRFP
jgi:Tfp pilus assembly protein FimV